MKGDARLMEDVVSGPERFRRWNMGQLQAMERELNRAGYSLSGFASIMEMGCSYGRLLRNVSALVPGAAIYGCDVLPEMLERCRKAIPGGSFVVNSSAPPIAFPDGTMNFIFTFSVFTHLSEPNHIAWLAELGRKLRPGGVMLHTTHGYECIRRLRLFGPERLAPYEIPCGLDEFMEVNARYHYVVDEPKTPEYGRAIISKDYVMANWERYSGLKIAQYAEGAVEANPEGCHDMVVLVKK